MFINFNSLEDLCMGKHVGIIGSGLAGLACALELEKNGVEVVVFEKESQPGGRVKTDYVDGFLLDHGFQVFLTSYEYGKYFFDYKKLELRNFNAGAILVKNQKKSLMADPLRQPLYVFESLFNSYATIKDKFLILKLKNMSKSLSEVSQEFNHLTTFDFLIEFGFSNSIINNFFKPFFSGVFLEEKLTTPAGFFLYLFGKFGSGYASLPKMGMQELIFQMQSKLKNKIVFNHEAKIVSSDEIIFNDGLKYDFDIVVSASGLLPKKMETDWNSVTTLYFKTKSNQFASKFLYLNTNSEKVVNHVACLTAAQPSYAPRGWHLYSVNAIGVDLSSEADVLTVTNDLKNIFPDSEIESWIFLKSYYVKKALPVKTNFGHEPMINDGIYYCGDDLEAPSIQGALASGFKLANKILS